MGGSVWVVSCTVLDHGVLSVYVYFSVNVETEGYSVSVYVDASTGVETGGAASYVCVAASIERDTGGCGVEECGATLACGGPKGWQS